MRRLRSGYYYICIAVFLLQVILVEILGEDFRNFATLFKILALKISIENNVYITYLIRCNSDITNLSFPRPVILEVPHFASLRGKQREIIVLRSDNGETWKEHTLEANEEAVQDVFNHSFEGDGMALFKYIYLY